LPGVPKILFFQEASRGNMATHKLLAKPNQIDSKKVCILALKQVKCAVDYHQIGSVNSTEVLTPASWVLTQTLSDMQLRSNNSGAAD
jgi:hypothetical protein